VLLHRWEPSYHASFVSLYNRPCGPGRCSSRKCTIAGLEWTLVLTCKTPRNSIGSARSVHECLVVDFLQWYLKYQRSCLLARKCTGLGGHGHGRWSHV
jgi:hypothetical protein